MAKLKAPLLSRKAFGKLADQITFTDRRGRPEARKSTTPANPRTPAQTQQRTYVEQAASVLPLVRSSPAFYEPFQRYKSASRYKNDWISLFMSTMLLPLKDWPTPVFFPAASTWPGLMVGFFAASIFGIPFPTEPGFVDIYSGLDITGMIRVDRQPFPTGALSVGPIGSGGETRYFQIRKGRLYRSGIIQVTMQA